jgi:DNA-3-methyladenine glycosylase II
MPFRATDIAAAVVQLRAGDPTLRRIVDEVGPFTLKTKRDHFATLVDSIVSQQISTTAAKTILGRLQAHLGPGRISAEGLAGLSVECLRGLGISQQKAGYLRDLAERVRDGRLEPSKLSRMSDDKVIAKLVEVRGIGVWTAQMFLIFSLGRLDVLPVGDFGIRTAVKRQYGFAELPGAEEIELIAAPWRPYASVASWYLWRSLG